ncbi:hypothetical protein FISHEDRAFT_74239 [Fistulina hepatica ATCC 64428]|uniref:Uncharacterized protein n=1 Tax=Fistulina hepatica ATCC 64428 TaxID=1128425 RepID=A0A0D7ADE3_9AGAR|nr:hypothetical protein FISHEDRAFT_74239 [Fistulina hepatica ATCC 64428]
MIPPHPFAERELEEMPSDQEEEPRILAEQRMNALSWSIRRKPNWETKLKDPTILAKWRSDAFDAQKSLKREEKMTENMAPYARLIVPESGIKHACDDAIFWADKLVSQKLTDDLRREVAKLEDVPESEKDWHPGSNHQVLDLVHPPLYCIVYGVTRAREFDKSGPSKVVAVPGKCKREEARFMSRKLAWLPSDFAVSNKSAVSLASPYINNVHPSNKGLISAIEGVLGKFIPMFERVLGAVDREDKLRYYGKEATHARIHHDACLWEKHGEQDYLDDNYEDYAAYPGEDADEQRLNWYRTMDDLVLPDALPQYNSALENRFRLARISGDTIQVIVKLGNIHLTPENPEYAGGSWHVEGMLNERIVAIGIYYYDSENITESQLQFRVPVSVPSYHMSPDDTVCLSWIYGITQDMPLVQDIGAVPTSVGTSLAFPNIYQHRVSPFKLADPTKPGHRKILAFFLVDPTKRVLSATEVLPQQRKWIRDEIALGPASQSRLGRLPPELRDMILDHTDGLMTREDAEEYRAELIEERSQFAKTYNDEIVQCEFIMCEHMREPFCDQRDKSTDTRSLVTANTDIREPPMECIRRGRKVSVPQVRA